MNSSDLIRELHKLGWQLVRVKGSHHIFKHPCKLETVVIPHPKKDLKIGLVKSTKKKAGI